MKLRFLLTALLVMILSSGASFAHGDHDKCCKGKSSKTTCREVDDCDLCHGLFRGWGGHRRGWAYQQDNCCSKDKKETTACSKSCGDDCGHSWRGRRSNWRHHYRFHHTCGDNGHDNDKDRD
ncbi:MAG: hypothetical protein V4649_05695 [Bacteroidota bacterium]